jgi:hypothetical protein
MLTRSEAADRTRCEGTVTPSTAGPDSRPPAVSGADRGQVFIQAAKPRRTNIEYAYV